MASNFVEVQKSVGLFVISLFMLLFSCLPFMCLCFFFFWSWARNFWVLHWSTICLLLQAFDRLLSFSFLNNIHCNEDSKGRGFALSTTLSWCVETCWSSQAAIWAFFLHAFLGQHEYNGFATISINLAYHGTPHQLFARAIISCQPHWCLCSGTVLLPQCFVADNLY